MAAGRAERPADSATPGSATGPPTGFAAARRRTPATGEACPPRGSGLHLGGKIKEKFNLLNVQGARKLF